MGRVTPLNKTASDDPWIAPDDRAIRERIRAWYSCWPRGHADRGAIPLTGSGCIRLLSDFGSDVAISQNLAQYRQLWQPVLEDTFKRWHISIVSAINLRRTQDMAAANFFTELSGITHEDGVMNQTQAVSQIWEKITGGWHLVHEHSTVHNGAL